MPALNKKALSERDICSKFITPALKLSGWEEFSQIRDEVGFTKGRIIVRGRLVTRGNAKRAGYILYYKPNFPLALIEAKHNNHSLGDGMQQALEYAATLNIPFVFSSNGDAFLFHDCTGAARDAKVSAQVAGHRANCPGRAAENSPTLQRWGPRLEGLKSRRDGSKGPRIQPSLRDFWPPGTHPQR